MADRQPATAAGPTDLHLARERTTDMAEVRIDGVLYAPVSEAHIDVEKIIDALVKQWGGDDWQQHYADAPNYLRVVVSDTFEEGEGESVTEFAARIIANVSESDSTPATAATDDGPVTSNRTHERATALAWMRGCEQDNGCWPDCYDAALSAVVEDRLDDVERTWATTSTYWKLTHGVSPRDI